VTGRQPDLLTFALWASLLAAGAIAVTSASLELSASRYGGDTLHLAARHGVYVLAAGIVYLLVLATPTATWQRLAGPAYLLAVLLLVAVLLPIFGRKVNGSLRWIGVGPITLQPSEVAKFLLVLYLADALCRREQAISCSLRAMVALLGWLMVPVVLVLAEPDLGSAVVIIGTAAGLLLLAGARVLHMLLLALLAVAAVAALVLLQPYRLQRLEAFLNPWAPDIQFGSGYQLTQALIAFGRGEWTGVGLGEGLQKLFYLPEAHTDFIFAVIAEETGGIGALLICAALGAIVVRGLMHGRVAETSGDRFAAQLAYGAALMLGVQALVSLGVNTGLLPTKGLTLPLISYGGNSLLVSSALVALIARVHWETQAEHLVPARRVVA
jgi:cell division protein FtsW